MAVDVDKLNFVCSKGMDMHEGADVAGYKSFVLKVKLQCDDIKLLKHVRFLHSIGSRVLGHWILNMIASSAATKARIKQCYGKRRQQHIICLVVTAFSPNKDSYCS